MNQLDAQIAEEQRKNKTEDSFVLRIRDISFTYISFFYPNI